MALRFILAARRDILKIDPDVGTPSRELGERPRRTLLKWGLADTIEGDDGAVVVLTEAGAAVQEIMRELVEKNEKIQRLVADGLSQAIAGRPRGSPAPLSSTVQSRGPTCGSLNHDSFSAFISSLEAAGKNRWKDPKYMGEGPAHARFSPARKE